MEKRKSIISALKACRFCLTQDEQLSSIFDKKQTPKKGLSTQLQILCCLTMEVFPSDRMPIYICDRCKFFIEIFYKFKQICRQTDETIMHFIQHDDTLASTAWPSKLTKLFRVAITPTKKQGKVIETDSLGEEEKEMETEDDDDNIYNIKIGREDDDSACIEVFKSGKEQQPKNKSDYAESPSRQGSGSSRISTCNICKKSFSHSHHLSRHIRAKHKIAISSHSPFGEQYQFNCDQCEETFVTQDELIYHSAKHATENLTCPLCHEKFDQVEEVSAHIKTHVEGAEFMCDLCELVFTSKEKLDAHLIKSHDEEINQDQDLGMDEESMPIKDEEFEDNINLKDEGDHMVVEIKKPSEFIIRNKNASNQLPDEPEQRESDRTYTELATVDTLALAKENIQVTIKPLGPNAPIINSNITLVKAPVKEKNQYQQAQVTKIINKAEDVKKKVPPKFNVIAEVRPIPNKQDAVVKQVTLQQNKSEMTKPEGATVSSGTSDKSLRLLEKELQELKRTNSQNNENNKSKQTVEIPKRGRPPMHTSTPKPRDKLEDRKPISKTPSLDKKVTERRVVTKENKEPKAAAVQEAKEPKNSVNSKDEKEEKKDSNNSKSTIKNGPTDKSIEEAIRRSSRASKVKDYAKMVRDTGSSSDTDDGDEEYKDVSTEKVHRNRKPAPIMKASPKPNSVINTPETVAATPVRKRGRPRKENKEVPSKIKKDNDSESKEEPMETEKPNVEEPKVVEPKETKVPESPPRTQPTPATNQNLIMSPTGQTLKKVQVKTLPPGVKPLPLPMNARPVGTGELCEMQIGKKMVKVQKIVMTKAEVEAMAKKGLVEMKDGTMVLKQGIKLPTADPAVIKSTLVGSADLNKNSTSKAAPTRCSIGDN